MDEIKKLFQAKRIFAMILAAAMVITMMPTTANAASVNGMPAETQETSGDTAAPEVTGSVVNEQIQTDRAGESVWEIKDNRPDNSKTAVYDGEPEEFWDGQYNLVVYKDGSYYNELNYCNDFSKVWQEKTGEGNEDKDYTALPNGEQPTNAGEYRLAVTAPDSAAKWNFIFTITPCEPQVTAYYQPVKPGVAKKDVKPESLLQSLYFTDGNSNDLYFTTTLENGDISGYETPIPGTILVSVAQIKNAVTNEPLKDTDVLTKDQDYVVDLTLKFEEKANTKYGKNYILPETISKLITIGNLIVPTVVVDLGEKQELDADGKPVTDADGKPVMQPVTELERTYTGETVKEPEKDKEYTVKIELDEEVEGPDGQPVKKTIPVTDENLTAEWFENGEKLDSAPKAAGNYSYRITYIGQEGIYAAAYADIPVVVNAAELTIVPKLGEGAKFYPGMTVKQALAQVDYTVLDAEKQSFDANVDRNSFWGTYANRNLTIPYEPVFGIQVKERTDEILNDDGTTSGTVDIYGDGNGNGSGYLSAGTALQSGKTYRVVFTGKKAVYYGDGDAARTTGINAAVTGNNFNTSYHVADDSKTNEENAAALPLEAGTRATIESNLLKDGKGGSYDNPISKVYDGERLFDRRSLYKIAAVTADGKKIAEKTDKAITYTWERQNGVDYVYDSEGNVVTDQDGNPKTEPAWDVYDYDGETYLSDLISPVNAGNYRLTISYSDSKNDKDGRGYYADPVQVYYEIKAQKIGLVPDGEFAAPVGYTVNQFLYHLYDSGELDPTGELPHKVYKLDENLGYTQEDELNWLFSLIDVFTGEAIYYHPYTIDDWAVEKKNGNNWEHLNYNAAFEAGGEYRLVPAGWDVDFSSYKNNYSTHEMIADENGDEWPAYYVNSAPIKLTTMGSIALGVELDISKITASMTKVYDGTPISILDEAKKNLVVYKLDDANKTPVTDVLKDIEYVWYDDEGYPVATAEPVDAGTYELYAKFSGNASYMAFDSYDFCLNTGLSVTITPRELTVVPSLKEPIVAGNKKNYSDWAKTEFQNVAQSDAAAFTYNATTGFPAVNSSSYGYRVCDKAGQYVYGKLKGNTDYTFEFTNIQLRGKYADNYTLKYGKAAFKTVHGYSSVSGGSYRSVKEYQFEDAVSDVDKIGTHTITTKEGIEYQYDFSYYNSETGSTEEAGSGNFVALKITMPEEYSNASDAEVVYANSIKKAGGIILNKSNFDNGYTRNLEVLFNAEDGKEKPIEFDIRWEEGYVEHFILDFTKAELLEDLGNAVAPKTISLNKPDKKMVVGGTQRLDVKLTTSQIGDLIHLTYTVDKPEVLCVTESGFVTALKEGDATITVESTRRDGNGEYVSTNPVKKTSVKIKVSKVSAPKIKKVDNVLDNSARVWWTPLNENDGYRREIYVLEGKTTYTKDDFEAKIASMKNGNWEDIFAVAPTYNAGYYDEKAKSSYDYVDGLSPDKEYTVYVRNVSRVRTLSCAHENCQVAESHDGNVKGFKTTKGQVKGLNVAFEDEIVTQYVDINDGTTHHMVALKEGATTATVYGNFSDWVNAAGDYDVKTLPLSKEDQKDYVNPKLEYYVGSLVYLEDYDSKRDGYIGVYRAWDEDEGITEYYYCYLNKTSFASIDKKGKLKLNGVGEVDVVVRDKNTGLWAYKTLEIVATADSIANKNVKMQVGQKIWLGDLLTYKEGKKVLIGNYARKIVVDDALRQAISTNGNFKLSEDETYLIAIKPGKLSLTLKDAYVGEDKTATVSLTATALEPVKKLKASTVNDQYFDLEFTHSLNPYEIGYKDSLRDAGGLIFHIKVTDARGTLIRSQYVEADDYYDAGTNQYKYRIDGLTKKSKYNVSVTAEFEGEVSKEAKKPITTTLLPASYLALAKKDINTGIKIYVHGEEVDDTINRGTFSTGNSYTLEVGGTYFNPGAKAAMTDTLTWTSSNTKVATVKANAGSYSAALKAVGQGKTVIEIKSKVTKAVIARYELEVSTVGDAYRSRNNPIFFGDNEYLEKNAVSSVIGYATKNGTVVFQ